MTTLCFLGSNCSKPANTELANYRAAFARSYSTALGLTLCLSAFTLPASGQAPQASAGYSLDSVTAGAAVHGNATHDLSPALSSLKNTERHNFAPECGDPGARCGTAPAGRDGFPPADADEDAQESDAADAKVPPTAVIGALGAAVEQTVQGSRAVVPMLESFDGLGAGFTGPQGTASTRNPSDNTLAVGPDHIVQIVNSRMAVYTKKGSRFDSTGQVLYGPVLTNTIFVGFGGPCEHSSSGDAVVRYDQLAKRWLYVLPIFHRPEGDPKGPYSMCYAVSQGPDPLGPYYRYEFKRPLFPDYPRPAIWPDGYYVPTSVGDNVVEKQACVADRTRMLAGLPATEQCIKIDGVNFLNNADIDGQALPPAGAPNIMIAAGGTQLQEKFEDDGLYVYEFHVDWTDPNRSSISAPRKIAVAPYHYLCDGQLTKCVPQPGTPVRLDAQGDKLMQRLVYRKIGRDEWIAGLHSVDTRAGGGGVRWYELKLDRRRAPRLYQQGTYAPDGFYRWMGSLAIDQKGDIGIGYSFGGDPNMPGQRFAARLAKDPKGVLSFKEAVLAEGQAAQTNTLRWEDYSTVAMDPSDDCTFWYVGDYIKTAGASYSTRIGGFRLPGCSARR
jgi:hypothetical protein